MSKKELETWKDGNKMRFKGTRTSWWKLEFLRILDHVCNFLLETLESSALVQFGICWRRHEIAVSHFTGKSINANTIGAIVIVCAYDTISQIIELLIGISFADHGVGGGKTQSD